nr:hypothetical protein [Antarcticirhabdus aurantiaca]
MGSDDRYRPQPAQAERHVLDEGFGEAGMGRLGPGSVRHEETEPRSDGETLRARSPGVALRFRPADSGLLAHVRGNRTPQDGHEFDGLGVGLRFQLRPETTTHPLVGGLGRPETVPVGAETDQGAPGILAVRLDAEEMAEGRLAFRSPDEARSGQEQLATAVAQTLALHGDPGVQGFPAARDAFEEVASVELRHVSKRRAVLRIGQALEDVQVAADIVPCRDEPNFVPRGRDQPRSELGLTRVDARQELTQVLQGAGLIGVLVHPAGEDRSAGPVARRQPEYGEKDERLLRKDPRDLVLAASQRRRTEKKEGVPPVAHRVRRIACVSVAIRSSSNRRERQSGGLESRHAPVTTVVARAGLR